MKRIYALENKTKAEYASGAPGTTVLPQHFATLAGAKAAMKTNLTAGTISFCQIVGPSGICAAGRNPAGG